MSETTATRTRLDRLVALLDGSSGGGTGSGSTSSTATGTGTDDSVRTAAAQQLGELVRARPGHVVHVLQKIRPLLRNRVSWRTRMTAAMAIGEVARAVPEWKPSVQLVVTASAGTKATSSATSSKRADGASTSVTSTTDEISGTPLHGTNANTINLDPSLLTLARFSLANVLERGDKLLASAGKEFDDVANVTLLSCAATSSDARERLRLQQVDLRRRLGLGSEFIDLLDEQDLAVTTTKTGGAVDEKVAAENVAAKIGIDSTMDADEDLPVSATSLSARERARLKRKARVDAKKRGGGGQTVVRTAGVEDRGDAGGTAAADTSATSAHMHSQLRPLETREQRLQSLEGIGIDEIIAVPCLTDGKDDEQVMKNAASSMTTSSDDSQSLIVEARRSTFVWEDLDEWPFAALCEELALDLFDPHWEIRHGAAVGLREIIKAHGRYAGRTATIVISHDNNSALKKGTSVEASLRTHIMSIWRRQNHAWLEDIMVRLVCVFALDRFSDFEGDSVVVPVRETCAQTVGWTRAMLQDYPQLILSVLRVGLLPLVEMQGRTSQDTSSTWDLRYGGMVAIKYILGIRKDLVETILAASDVMNAVVAGLSDVNDDLRAVAASTLVPMAEEMVARWSKEQVAHVTNLLWDALGCVDDLSASTASIMELLAQFYVLTGARAVVSGSESLIANAPIVATTLTHLRETLFPRLYPLFRHTIASVRAAVLRAATVLVPIMLTDVQQSNHAWLSTLMEFLFQNIIVESREAIAVASAELWLLMIAECRRCSVSLTTVILQSLPRWLHLLSTPIGTPLAAQLLPLAGNAYLADVQSPYEELTLINVHTLNISAHDVAMLKQDMEVVDRSAVLHGRMAAASVIARTFAGVDDEGFIVAIASCNPISNITTSRSVISGQLYGWMIEEWATTLAESGDAKTLVDCPALPISTLTLTANLHETLMAILESLTGAPAPLADLRPHYASIRAECIACLSALATAGGISMKQLPTIRDIGFSLGDAQLIVADWVPTLVQSVAIPEAQVSSFQSDLEQRLARIAKHMSEIADAVATLDLSVQTSCAAALLRLAPAFHVFDTVASSSSAAGKPKLNPIVRSLMNGIKFERDDDLRQRNARTLARFIIALLCLSDSEDRLTGEKVATKIVRNLCNFICADLELARVLAEVKWSQKVNMVVALDDVEDKKEEEEDTLKEAARATAVTVDGATKTLEFVCKDAGPALQQWLPFLLDTITSPLRADVITELDSEFNVVPLVHALWLIGRTSPAIHSTILQSAIYPAVPILLGYMCAPWPILRHFTARAISTICKCALDIDTSKPSNMQSRPPILAILDITLPMLGDTTSVIHRLGAAELILHLFQTLPIHLLPYLVFFLVPVLGRMSDQDDAVRNIVTKCFANMMRLMPLEAAAPEPTDLPQAMLERKTAERKFITQLLDPSKLEPFVIPVPIHAVLRSYQQEGVNWLGFLNKYQLHGILCDDMGLGKTLQTICIIASDKHLRAERFAKSGAPDARPLPNLVICPTSVTGHWKHEVVQYTENLRPLVYAGPAAERKRLHAQLSSHDVIITSYDVLRNDVDVFRRFNFNYCVLDEGHIIKNTKTKITAAVKAVRANHRLILSGTPIQNNVLELWSLFDFLMPGFLGSEQQFSQRYAKPIMAMKAMGGKMLATTQTSTSESTKADSKQAQQAARAQEAGSAALESLHRQVLPFLMRRMKEEVLADLPPKIIQDYECELSPLQRELYDQFIGEYASTLVQNVGVSKGKELAKNGGANVFQALQYLRKLCNHPSLVVGPTHPSYTSIQQKLQQSEYPDLKDVRHSPKLMALKELLNECGIGAALADVSTSLASHRALIFCQLKSMVDFIEHDLLSKHLPNVSYLRMDGTTDAAKRQDLVVKFNADPSIDVMLLTTNVGGLGLNLTGADTVIFVEHDFNPMKDLQAMDRAHRLGQKRTVNVYRLITKDTLEEKIMGLQRFKLNIANTVVNEENAGGGLRSMANDEILELFNAGGSGNGPSATAPARKKPKLNTSDLTGLPQALADAADQVQGDTYDQDFDFDRFVSSMEGKQ